jgi:hypothetical protein
MRLDWSLEETVFLRSEIQCDDSRLSCTELKYNYSVSRYMDGSSEDQTTRSTFFFLAKCKRFNPSVIDVTKIKTPWFAEIVAN